MPKLKHNLSDQAESSIPSSIAEIKQPETQFASTNPFVNMIDEEEDLEPASINTQEFSQFSKVLNNNSFKEPRERSEGNFVGFENLQNREDSTFKAEIVDGSQRNFPIEKTIFSANLPLRDRSSAVEVTLDESDTTHSSFISLKDIEKNENGGTMTETKATGKQLGPVESVSEEETNLSVHSKELGELVSEGIKIKESIVYGRNSPTSSGEICNAEDIYFSKTYPQESKSEKETKLPGKRKKSWNIFKRAQSHKGGDKFDNTASKYTFRRAFGFRAKKSEHKDKTTCAEGENSSNPIGLNGPHCEKPDKRKGFLSFLKMKSAKR